jgi:hypothetical protein
MQFYFYLKEIKVKIWAKKNIQKSARSIFLDGNLKKKAYGNKHSLGREKYL